MSSGVTKISSLLFNISLNFKLCRGNLSTYSQVKSFEQVPRTPPRNFIQQLLKNIRKKYENPKQINVNYERDDYFSVLYKRYGTIVKDGTTKIVHLFDPKDVEILFKNEARSPTKIMFETLQVARDRNKDVAPKISVGLDQDSKWFTLRKKMNNYLFNPQTALNLCPAFDHIATDFVNNISARKNKNNDCVEHLYEELCKLAFENAGSLMFGKRLGSFNLDQSDSILLVTALENLFTVSYKLDLGFPWYKWFSTPTYKIVEQNYTIISKISSKYMHLNIEDIRSKPETETKGSFLAKLLSRKDVDNDDIFAIITDLLIGGIDTTATSTSMILYHLSKNPNKQQKLYEEIQQYFPNPKEVITIGQLQPLSYLKACINETLRLTPVVDMTSRILHKDHVFSGYSIPSKTKIVVHHRLMGKIYFTNSNKFEPERWLNDKEQHISHSWLPFGLGARSCPGRKIAQLQMLLLSIRIVQRYKLSYDGDDYVTTTSRFVNKPSKDLNIKFLDRNI